MKDRSAVFGDCGKYNQNSCFIAKNPTFSATSRQVQLFEIVFHGTSQTWNKDCSSL